MSEMPDATYVRLQMLQPAAPPVSERGVVKWGRENLFSGPFNTILTVLSVVASSAGSMAATRNQKFGYNTWSSLAWSMLYGGVMSIVIGLLMGKSLTMDVSSGYVLSLIYLAVFGSIITFGCYHRSERFGAITGRIFANPRRTAFPGPAP